MRKLVPVILATCFIFQTSIVSTKQLKVKKTWKPNSGIIRQDHRQSNRTHSTKWSDVNKYVRLSPNEICDIICDPVECIEYSCPDGVCCTPGSPESLCCPLDHPLCVYVGCCAAGHPEVCGQYCCEVGQTCCPLGCCESSGICCGSGCCELTEVCCLDHCCDAGDTCCGSGCCESNETCCGGNSCCKQNETCCGNECCTEGEKCCMKDGQQSCCSGKESNACSSAQYSDPCPYQFDVHQCQQMSYTNQPLAKYTEKDCPDILKTGVLYRPLRADESCYEGLKARSPHASESVLSFVNCGSKNGYMSQFISSTSSLEVAKSYQNGTIDVKIAQIDVNKDLLAACHIVDLTDVGQRKKHLGDAKSNQFAAEVCEYLLTCNARVPCKEVTGK
ncbi:keratin-associated protein 10-11-like [Mercenaria mercenaria]|uniref:keratin-associated protein 10-11-like n=1 Tax=Mercenaria mercenaria TaxID=6596 RepID=UPI001E1D556A|nr:keratin-associated protein 10-11-like [Mercenaria mercenaria]